MDEGRRRVVIEGVSPEIDGGQFAIKRVVGESVVVEADIYTDGHDAVSCALRYRRDEQTEWTDVPMTLLGNDRWRASFPVMELGSYRYTLIGWVDHFLTWSRDLSKRIEAGQDVAIDLEIGARMVDAAASRASRGDAATLRRLAKSMRGRAGLDAALSPELGLLMERYGDRRFATDYRRELPIVVDPPKARFSTWYELFPRSASPDPTRHGTFADVRAMLPEIVGLGFDVLYLPPIHPIGERYRKGKNNTTEAGTDDPGSPWAIGGAHGGHKSIHPELGTLDDFRQLVDAARDVGIDIAMDIAFQVAPDHPWVEDHRAWFRERPDGTIQYAENPPKKYQDIYPFDFESEDWEPMWRELASVFTFWRHQGVRIFRVDNPHTKAFGFWDWCIDAVKRQYPDVILLSEAFTRPKVMYRLAKGGFTQSYTYFTWRNTAAELREYFTELTRPPVVDFFRPNLWPNTPDILPEALQLGGRPAFIARLVLAATLGASYGMYAPAFELMEAEPLAPGREEYLNSEKYEIRRWDWNRSDSLRPLIALVNRIRRDNPALQSDRSLRFHPVDNDQLLAYSKVTEDGSNAIITIVNVDPHHRQSGWLNLQLDEFGIAGDQPFQVHDLLGGGRFLWQGGHNYVELDPVAMPAHIFRLRHRMKTEQDFDYFV
ncbi:MAG TPA: alpha-1,4-glucan--maltose-1-phosphate maltosyltransferase [Thermomicrobiales bacterium]|nr:alpha-1,4-glucan--maltose-1-phosphate maltosyltransferase [Thermomicrobiales bacterium]